MKFRTLEVYELTTEDNYTLRASFEDVDVTFSCCQKPADILAMQGDRVVAAFHAWEDCPVEIQADHIEVHGGAIFLPQPVTVNGYGKWILR